VFDVLAVRVRQEKYFRITLFSCYFSGRSFCGSEGNATYIELLVALDNLKANSPPTHAG